MTTNAEIYQSVTARILECLDKGVVPWRKPWAVQAPRNLSSGHVYRGINPILLSCNAFSSPYWVTDNQANALGGKVKPYPAKKALGQARALGSDGIRRAFDALAKADLDLKGASGIPEEAVMEVLVVRLCRLTGDAGARGARGGGRPRAGSRR